MVRSKISLAITPAVDVAAVAATVPSLEGTRADSLVASATITGVLSCVVYVVCVSLFIIGGSLVNGFVVRSSAAVSSAGGTTGSSVVIVVMGFLPMVVVRFQLGLCFAIVVGVFLVGLSSVVCAGMISSAGDSLSSSVVVVLVGFLTVIGLRVAAGCFVVLVVFFIVVILEAVAVVLGVEATIFAQFTKK